METLKINSPASGPRSRNQNWVKRLYWIITALYAAMLLMGGGVELRQGEEGRAIMRHLGYPVHVLLVIGLGKVLAALALLQPRFRTLKEWAYAGVTFNLIGAFVARFSAGDSTGLILSPLIFLGLLFVSYVLWKKIDQ